MSLGNVARVVAVLAAVVAAAGSATSESNKPAVGQPPQYGAQPANNQPPPPQQMEPSAALGLWRSTFGAVKIEADNSKGGLQAGAVQGIWVYQKQGQEVVGYFAGSLRGNVLQFQWQEPSNPPLTGAGYLVFDVQGRQYSGRWWSDRRDRVGDWNGWRNAPVQTNTGYAQPYGGQGYADPYARPPQPGPYAPAPQPGPYDRQPQPGPYQPAPQPGPYDRQPQPGPYDRQPQPGPYDRQPQQPPPPPRGYY
ncbi:MAG: hypothetical protein H0T42_24990 [Deltaproteobacteria bacterium]|nr:hypothetical protein [Deltaproteobacteria bacterium]